MSSNFPESLGKYKLVREIGRGANAVVYEAVDTTLDRVVALKVLHPGIFADPVLVTRFEREAKAEARLDHPHIVTIYEFGEWQGTHYIAEKYVAGHNLKQVIEAGVILPLERIVKILDQVAGALDFAHANGFIHRDLKPSNILLGENDYVTLTDFGLVKAIESSSGVSSGNTILGTPAYISPELWEGQEATAQSDIYALGVILYEALTGKVPFDAPTPAAVMRQHLDTPVPLLSLSDGATQSALQPILEATLAKQPNRRPKNAHALVKDLARVQESIPSNPKIQDTAYLPLDKGSNRRTAINATIIVLVVLCIGVIVVAYFIPRDSLTGGSVAAALQTATVGHAPSPTETLRAEVRSTIVHTQVPAPSLTSEPTETYTPAVTSTPSVSSSRTYTPTPTKNLTPRPTTTPRPTFTTIPSPTALGSGVLQVKRVIQSSSFDNPSQEPFQAVGNVAIRDGMVTISDTETLNDSRSSLRYHSPIKTGTAFVLLFKPKELYRFAIGFDSGRWATPNYRRLGLEGATTQWQWVVYSGDIQGDHSFPNEYVPFEIPQDNVWYYLMLRMRADGSLEGKLWQRDDPTKMYTFSRTVSGDWLARPFMYEIDIIQGTVDIDAFQQLELAE